MNPAENKALRRQVVLLWWLGLALIPLAWETAPWSQSRCVLPGPAATWEALLGLARNRKLGAGVLLVLQWALGGLGIAYLIGLPWGWTVGTWRPVEELTASWTQLLTVIPPIAIVVVGILWLGPNPSVVLLMVALVMMPLSVTSLRDAVINVDPDLLETTRLFRFSLWGTVRRVIIPAVVLLVLSAVTVAVGQSVRLAVMVELLSTTIGLGTEAQQAHTNPGIADMFTLSAVMATLTLGLELLFLRPLRNRLTQYR